jgi:hypothetical protein
MGAAEVITSGTICPAIDAVALALTAPSRLTAVHGFGIREAGGGGQDR